MVPGNTLPPSGWQKERSGPPQQPPLHGGPELDAEVPAEFPAPPRVLFAVRQDTQSLPAQLQGHGVPGKAPPVV